MAENTDAMFDSDEMFVLTGKEIAEIISEAAWDDPGNAKKAAKKLAVPLREMDA